MGRRWGKTFMAGVMSAEAAKCGAHVAWVAPTYGNSRPMWRFVEQLAAQDKRIEARKAEREISMPRGGRIGVYTADNSVSIRGENFDIVICDEAPQYAPEVWTDVIMPTLADRDGVALLIGTPKGRNWFFQEYLRGLSDGKYQASFTAPSSDNPSPHIQNAARLALERVSERTYRQEWLAEFVEDGALFVNITEIATLQRQPYKSGHEYCIGVDWARSSGGDYTVFSVMDLGEREQVEMIRIAGATFDAQLSRLRSLWNEYGRCQIIAEYNSMGGPLVERLQTEGLPVSGFVTTVSSKHELITALELAFDNKEIKLLNDMVQTSELLAYEKKERVGLPSYSAPAGMYDDTVIALALSLRGGSSWFFG